MTEAWTDARRASYASDLRRVNPRRLAEWKGCPIRGGGGNVHPYQDYVRSYFLSAGRDVQIANLLIGDLFVEVLFDDDIRITDLATGDTWWPHRAAKRAQEMEARQ